MPQINKNSLRTETLNKLKNLSYNDRREIEARLYKYLFKSSLWNEANTIGITCSTNIEWNTEPIMERAWEENKIVAVPKTISREARLDFYRINNFSELISGYQQILEPKAIPEHKIKNDSIDLLIVPGVVFDERGYRIGFGGGYYDRFLVGFPNATISLLSTIQLVTKLPIEKHDIHVQYLLTEKGFREVIANSEV